MEDIIEQVKVALDAGLYSLALMGAMTLPDICAGLGSDSGNATRARCIAWLKAEVAETQEEAELLYGFRCSLLHQASPYAHRTDVRVIFLEPGLNIISNCWVDNGGIKVWFHSIDYFVDRIIGAVRRWLAEHSNDPKVEMHLDRCVRRHARGLPPFVVGRPVIG